MPNPKSVPPEWPVKLPYLSSPVISSDLPKTILDASTTVAQDVYVITRPQTLYTNIRITSIDLPTHPAFPQFGLFAARALEPDSFVCLYLGLIHSTETTDPASNYDLSLDREAGLAIDAASMGNEARFINDYRGIKDRPNAEFRDVIVKVEKGGKERGVGVFVKPYKKGKGKEKGKAGYGIRKGEEILVSYGRGFWSHR